MKTVLLSSRLIAFGMPVAVLATNPATRVRDIENPARHPFVVEGTVEFESGGHSISKVIGEVPAGKRAAIEFISMQCTTVPPDTIIDITFFSPKRTYLDNTRSQSLSRENLATFFTRGGLQRSLFESTQMRERYRSM